MRRWSTALLPLSLLLALTALTFWLRYATELPAVPNDGKTRHDPDFVVTEAKVRKLDKDGKLQYTLVADEIRHYPDDDASDLAKPKLVYLFPTRPTVTISAEQGHANSKGEQVDLKDQVEIRRAATGKYEQLVLETPELTVLTDEERAFTKSPVVITQGRSWVKGVGMKVDHQLQTYVLESQVTGQIESQPARKKP